MVEQKDTQSSDTQEINLAAEFVVTAADLGQLVREYRKSRKLTLEEVAGLANLSVKFLSEFERGKETAELGKVLKAIRILGLDLSVLPRGRKSKDVVGPASVVSPRDANS